MPVMDIAITSDGDLSLSNGDLVTIENLDLYKQMASNRIKSVSIDWFKDNIGADLEELIGLPNTKDNAELGVDKIKQSLTFDQLFAEKDVNVKSYPKSKSRIGYEVTVTKQPFGSFNLSVALDLVKGVMIGV